MCMLESNFFHVRVSMNMVEIFSFGQTSYFRFQQLPRFVPFLPSLEGNLSEKSLEN